MASPPKPPPSSALVRRPAAGSQAQAQAQRLANEAELLAAATILEDAGDHFGAAELRVEHARTLADLDRRLDILRDAVARLPGGSSPSRHANAALAQALADALHLNVPGHTAPASLELERAHALMAAGTPDEAGAIFERLGLYDQAIDAYTRGGCLVELEYLLRLREHHAQTKAKQREVIDVLNRAHHAGRRNAELSLLQTARMTAGEVLDTAFAAQLDERERLLRRSLVATEVLRLRVRHDQNDVLFHVWTLPALIIGRNPSAHVLLSAPAISREHARIEIAPLPEAFRVRVFDHATKLGTFIDGEIVDPDLGAEINGSVAMMIGAEAPLHLHVGPWPQESVCRLEIAGSPKRIHQLVREATPLALSAEPFDLRPFVRWVPAQPCPILDFAAPVQVWLNGHRLRRGADPEILVGDRLRAQLDDQPVWEFEVLPGADA